jgi:pullulanase/glycogen debranching enzyme
VPLGRDLLSFARSVIALRRRHPVLRRRQFFFGRKIRSSKVKDLSWCRPDGKEMTEESRHDALARCIGLRLAGDTGKWEILLDTRAPAGYRRHRSMKGGEV